MSARENEAVASEPVRVCGIVPQEPLKDQVGGGSEAHGSAGMPVPGMLNGIGCQYASRVDGTAVKVSPVKRCHVIRLRQSGRQALLRSPYPSTRVEGSRLSRL